MPRPGLKKQKGIPKFHGKFIALFIALFPWLLALVQQKVKSKRQSAESMASANERLRHPQYSSTQDELLHFLLK